MSRAAEIVVYTKDWCSYCDWAKDLLRRKGVAWEEINVSGDEAALEEMMARAEGRTTAPQIFIDGEAIGGYDEMRALDERGALDAKLFPGGGRPEGASREEKEGVSGDSVAEHGKVHEVIIVGSGCSGLTAAIYNARANLEPIVVEGREAGGQLSITTDVENFPGFPEGIQGPDLIQDMRKQAERFGTVYRKGDVTRADLERSPFRIWIEGEEPPLRTRTLIVATGASARMLGLEGEMQAVGHGVSTCATCDGFFFRGKEIAVVGGGDSAMEEATFLTKFASKVTVIHRRDELRASKIMQERAFQNDKIEFLWDSVVTAYLMDEGRLRGVEVRNMKTDEKSELAVDGCFLAIGHIPNTDFLKGQVELDPKGYLLVHRHTRTSRNGVFACGDVHDQHYRQAITASGMGCMAAMDAEKWLEAGGISDEDWLDGRPDYAGAAAAD